MADFCLECWYKVNGEAVANKKYVLSKDLGFCEECGEWKPVVIAQRKAYYMYRLRYIILPLRIICEVIYFLWRLAILPYLIYMYSKRNKERKLGKSCSVYTETNKNK